MIYIEFNGTKTYLPPLTVNENMYIKNKEEYKKEVLNILDLFYPDTENNVFSKEYLTKRIKRLERLSVLIDDRYKYKIDAIVELINYLKCNFNSMVCDI